MIKGLGAIVCTAVLLSGCQPRGSETAAGSNETEAAGPAGARIWMPAATGMRGAGASTAAGAVAAAPVTAAATGAVTYGVHAAAVPVRVGKFDKRFGHTELSATARERRLDAKEATQLINARTDKLAERYGARDTTLRGRMVERGVVLKEALPVQPTAAGAADTTDP